MKASAYVFLGTLLALLLISSVAGNDSTRDEIKSDEPNHVADPKHYGGGGWGGWGGYGGGGGWGWGWGGRGGGGGPGGWGGGCRWGCCGGGQGYWGGWGGGGGGCRCCYTAQEALAYMQNQARP